jgi:ribosomal protein S12 methylthiotransferase
MGKVALVTLGCPKNLVDSENLLDRLRREGFGHAEEPGDADLVIVNTCGFIEDAKRESIEEILKLKAGMEDNQKVLVFGCLAQRYRHELLREIPEIDALWGVGEDDRIVEYCRKALNRADMESGETGNADLHAPPRHFVSASPSGRFRPYAYLKIADGCSRRCTFCVIPSIRGPYRSIEPENILKKAEEYVHSGVRELILIAQDIGNYGREFKGYNLTSLLSDLSAIEGDFWIRLLYFYPAVLSDELLSVLTANDKICMYLDIPLQHSEDRILKAMGRDGTKDLYKGMIERLRSAIPEIVLRTTFIVGFPGESEEDFRGLIDFITEMRFDRLGVFIYSREEGTPASRMKRQVPKRTKEERRDEIMRIQSSISFEKNRSLAGRSFRTLVEEIDGRYAIGRIPSQAPEIDGVVMIDDCRHDNCCRISEKATKTDSMPRHSAILSVGEFADVRITGAYEYDLTGEPVL